MQAAQRDRHRTVGRDLDLRTGEDTRRRVLALVAGPGGLGDGRGHRAAEVGPGDVLDDDVGVTGRAPEQDLRLAPLLVVRGQTLEGVDGVGLRRGHLDGVAGQPGVPTEEPPAAVGDVGTHHVAVEVAGRVPVGLVGVHLVPLEHRDPLRELPGHGQVATVGVLVDVDFQRCDAEVLFDRAVTVVVPLEVAQRAGVQLVPGHDLGKDVLPLGEGEEVGQQACVIAGFVRAGDPRVGVDRADPLVHRLPVLEEPVAVDLVLRLVGGAEVVPDLVGLVEGDVDETVAVRVGRHLSHDLVDLGEVVVDAEVLVRPLGVDVLHHHQDLAAAVAEERLGDGERVAVGVLGAALGLLRDAGDLQGRQCGVTGHAVVAEPVQSAVGAVHHRAFGRGEVDGDALRVGCGGRGSRRGEGACHGGDSKYGCDKGGSGTGPGAGSRTGGGAHAVGPPVI